jgi:hypothetical protein
MHVASPPDTHEVWPAVQLSVQVKEHAAFGATPEHDFGLPQVEVEAT